MNSLVAKLGTWHKLWQVYTEYIYLTDPNALCFISGKLLILKIQSISHLKNVFCVHRFHVVVSCTLYSCSLNTAPQCTGELNSGSVSTGWTRVKVSLECFTWEGQYLVLGRVILCWFMLRCRYHGSADVK